MNNVESIVTQTENWAKLMAKKDVSPFARHDVDRESIRYAAVDQSTTEEALNKLVSECEYLMNHKAAEATLLIISNAFKSYDEFEELVGLSKKMLVEKGFSQFYKLATFHPEHKARVDKVDLFEPEHDLVSEAQGEPENDSNNPPYACLYIIKESCMEYRFEDQDDLAYLEATLNPSSQNLGLGKLAKPVKYMNLILAIGTLFLAIAGREYSLLLMVPVYLSVYFSIK